MAKSLETILAIITFILSQIEFLIAWVNRSAEDVIRKRFGLNPKFVQKINDDIIGTTQPKTEDEFLANIKAGFQGEGSVNSRFFKESPKFFEELASKAVSLVDSEGTPVAGEKLFKTVQVTLHQQVLYCDDSTSMRHEKTASNPGGRWDSQNTLINRIAHITTRILPEGEGTYLRYINQDVENSDSLSLEALGGILQQMKPKGLFTSIGTNLKSKILEPLVFSKLPNDLTRPLMISIITDGVPSGEPKSTLVENIIECGKKLEECGLPRSTVKFLIGQVGSNKKAAEFLKSISTKQEIADVVYVVPAQLDDPEMLDDDMKMDAWLIETLYKPILQAENYDSDGE